MLAALVALQLHMQTWSEHAAASQPELLAVAADTPVQQRASACELPPLCKQAPAAAGLHLHPGITLLCRNFASAFAARQFELQGPSTSNQLLQHHFRQHCSCHNRQLLLLLLLVVMRTPWLPGVSCKSNNQHGYCCCCCGCRCCETVLEAGHAGAPSAACSGGIVHCWTWRLILVPAPDPAAPATAPGLLLPMLLLRLLLRLPGLRERLPRTCSSLPLK
jgi:hypothetical protein